MAIDINIPSQVKNYANLAAFPATGSLKTIFIAEDTNKTYRWTGSAYVEISASQATAWGTITGTLSAQTDLNTALSGKQATVTLTTTGTSGASTFVANTLNVPTYSLSGLGGVPTSRTLTINGTTQDLSADRTFTISTGITIGTTAITSGTVGRVLFEGTGNVVSESANLFWDNTNGRLGIGTSSPSAFLDVKGNAIFGTGNAVSVGSDQVLTLRSSTTTSRFYLQNSGTGTNALSGVSFDLSNSIFEITNRQASGTIALITNGAERMRIASTGNVLINTTTDAGFKLDVNGTAIFRSNITLNSNALYIGTNSAMQLYTASSDIYIDNGNTSRKIIFNCAGSGQFQFNNGNVLVGTTSNIVSSKLTIESTTQGVLFPRMTTTQKNAIATPATGLQIYDSTLNRPCFYDGTSWITL
jgi:hypothetical protein